MRSFYHYLELDGYLEIDPTELLESPHLPQHLPEYLTTAEVDRLEDSIDLTTNEGQRNRAIIEVFFSCGLRVSEAPPTSRLSDLFLKQRFIRVIGKGNKERLIPISDRAIHELERGLTTATRWTSRRVRRIMSSSTAAVTTSHAR